MLSAKQRKEIQITFKTDEAKVVVATVIVKLMDRMSEHTVTKVLKVSAIGKYPFVTLDNTTFDFD